MGTIAEKLAWLKDTKAEIKAAIAAKGVSPSDSTPFRDYAGLIRAIATAVPVILQSKRVTPTGAELTVTADGGYTGLRSVTVEGEPNLIPGNIARGVTIYGVEGAMEVGSFLSATASGMLLEYDVGTATEDIAFDLTASAGPYEEES